MILTLIVLCLVTSGTATDLLLDMYNEVVNHKVDPCDNFFRHACRLGTDESQTIDNRVLMSLQNKSNPFIANIFSVVNSSTLDDFDDIVKSLHANKIELAIEKQFHIWCKNGNVNEIEYFMKNVFANETTSKEKICSAEAKKIRRLAEKYEISNPKIHEFLHPLYIHAVNAGIAKLSQKLNYIPDTFEEMRTLVLSWLTETPWAVRNNVIERYKKAIQTMRIVEYEENGDFIKGQKRVNEVYSECKKKLESTSTDTKLLCFLISYLSSELDDEQNDMANAFNMENAGIIFGPMYYYLSSNYVSEASNIGFVAQTIGHEFGHTLFDDDKKPSYGYFSKDIGKCVLDQYNSTCKAFKERHCAATDAYLEENGADLMGHRLGYEILKRRIGSKLHEQFPGMNVTHQQLYFYGYAFHSCRGYLLGDDGIHSADNIRINTVVQIPEFQEAFNCPADSKMMKTKTKECFVYGPQAPETKRKFAIETDHFNTE